MTTFRTKFSDITATLLSPGATQFSWHHGKYGKEQIRRYVFLRLGKRLNFVQKPALKNYDIITFLC